MTQITYEFVLAPQSVSSETIMSTSREHSGSFSSSTASPSGHSRHRHHHHHHHRSKRKPLEQSKLSVAARSRRAKRHPLALPVAPAHTRGDTTEFYTNIWTAPPTTAERNHASVIKFIDISQVAYVVTTIDYKQGYGSPRAFELANIWAPDGRSFATTTSSASAWSSDAASRSSMSVEVSHSPRYLSNLTDISEAPDEDDDALSSARTNAVYYLSNSMETPPPSTVRAQDGASRRLRHGVSDEELAHVASVPISGPLQRGDSIVFSPVLAGADNTVETSWHARFLLGIHEPVRHALFVIDRFLDRIQLRGSDWNVPAFFQWFKTHFVEFVKNQHDVKTKVLVPLLQLDGRVTRDVRECYARIYDVLDAIVAQEDQIVFSAASASASWRDQLFGLQSDIRKLNLLVHSILTAEEKVLSPLLGRTFSAANFQRYVVPRIFRASKPKRVVIPWIVERCRIWGGDDVAQAYKDDLPFTARFLYDRMWLPYFVSHVGVVMKQLDTEMTGMLAADAADSSWFGCSIQ